MSKDRPDPKLNLPRTAFPMRGRLPQLEPKILGEWWGSEAFRQHLKQKVLGRDRTFLLHDGPPYANGDIHSGHAINKVLKDVLVKIHWLNGDGGVFVPGWDCHGLPIELKVEEQLGSSAAEIGRREFRQACRNYALEQVERQKQGFIRLGVQGEWDSPYLTAEPKYEADMLRALAEIVRRGHLKHGHKPVHWCTQCGSALAEAEVEYRDHLSRSVDAAFPAADGALAEVFGLDEDAPLAVVAWTTTPWTLPANRALCVHPEALYLAARPKGEQRWLLIAAELLQQTEQRCGLQFDRRTDPVPGQRLAGLSARHPFEQREVPLIAAGHVTLEAGSGVVHTAPAHGLDDWKVGEQHGLDSSQLVQSDGTYVPELPHLGGMEVRSAEAEILDRMRRQGTLLADADYPHSYPHCWRHHSPLIFRATPQWFIGMHEAGLLDEAAGQAQTGVDFVPESGKNRFLAMLQERPDWCISRQRIWGVPLAIFQHRRGGEAHPRTAELLEQVAERIERDGLDAWDDLAAEELLGAEAADYEKCTDVLDVWFDSGVSHYCVLEQDQRLRAPADLYLEGSDQHRGWFQSSMLTSVAMGRGAPYRCLLTHGFLVDEQGNKMSKSRGNGVLPDEIWDKWGADVMRLWIASADYRGEMVLSERILASTADVYRKIRNTLRFMIGNLYDYDPGPEPQRVPDHLVELDRWALERAAETQRALQASYGRYRLHEACRLLHDFCSTDMGAFYLDLIKDRLYTCRTDGAARRSAQFALWHLARALARWMAPVLSFTAEEAWSSLWHPLGEQQTGGELLAPGRTSVLGETWHRLPEVGTAPQTVDWTAVRQVIRALNLRLEEARNAGAIGGALSAAAVIRDPEAVAALQPLGQEARFALLVSRVELSPAEGAASDALEVQPAPGRKCDRCWHRVVEDGAEEPFYCQRCRLNLGEGEQRRFA